MQQNPYESVATERVDVASEAEVEERLAFVRRTYLTLAAAIMAFVGLEFAIFQTGASVSINDVLLAWGPASFYLAVFLFMGVGWIANSIAHSDTAQWVQYAALGGYVLAESVIFVPLLTFAENSSDPTVIPGSAIITLSVFSVLTGYVFVTKQDFSFLRPALVVGFAVTTGAIAASFMFGFSLGLFFAAGMVLFAAGSIVYTTSNILHHYNTSQHAAAALGLFASIAMMFYYVLMLFVGGE
jgi:FtsH-binding integral membrane protein